MFFYFFQEDVLGLLKDAIHEKANEASGFLIDGFPRQIDQGNAQIEPHFFLILFIRIKFPTYFSSSNKIK